MTRSLAIFGLALIASMALFGCEQDCVYPNVETFQLRLLNSMPDQQRITVFLNGKRFKKDYSYAPPEDFAYTNIYEDGTPLPLGDSVELLVSSDPEGVHILHRGFIKPRVGRQTLIIAGRGEKLLAANASNTTHILLNDEDDVQDMNLVKIRLVHAISEMPALDVYFRTIPTDGSPVGSPNLSIDYGFASPRIPLPALTGLTVTRKGDSSDIILSMSFDKFNTTGFFVTAVLRGSANPCGDEPVPAPLLLSDVEFGKVAFDFSVFGVRFINVTKSTILSLTATNVPPGDYFPRTNIPGQSKVLNVPPAMASEYFGVGYAALGNTRWFYSRATNTDTVFATQLKANPNDRWSFIAFQNADDTYNGVKLKDTMACVPEAFGKIRVVNASSVAGPVTVEITGAQPMTLPLGEPGFATLTAGPRQITISSGPLTQTHTVTLPPARPISVYIGAGTQGAPFPITISQD